MTHGKWIVFGLVFLAGCRTADLSGPGAQVATSQSAPVDLGYVPSSCKSLGYIVGRGGGSFGGSWVSNESLIEYAMNDLRNQAAERGANYVQHDSPTLGVPGSDGATSTATVSGTAYFCSRREVEQEPTAENMAQ
ncbi:MAG TPA: DUF4156 domain-containing protein [Polyangiaceae bacterium]|nr:DUF4156 domain-containing protein [Polyangiaceae bacterium]